jgi:hypothetical protein
MQTIKNFFHWIINWRQRRRIAKRVAELRKRDPFIYK